MENTENTASIKYTKKTGAMLVGASNLIRIYSWQVFAKAGFDITPEQFAILEILIEQNGLYQRQLSEITMKDRPNISRIVTILEKKGYITKRSEDSNGRKVQKLYTTEKGRLEYERVIDSVMAMRCDYIEGVNEEDMKGCLNVLAQVKKNLYDKVNMQT